MKQFIRGSPRSPDPTVLLVMVKPSRVSAKRSRKTFSHAWNAPSAVSSQKAVTRRVMVAPASATPFVFAISAAE